MKAYLVILTLWLAISCNTKKPAYVLTFIMNAENLNPVILTDCREIDMASTESEIDREVEKLKDMKLDCEKIGDTFSYACTDGDKLLGRAIVLKDKIECANFANKTSKDLKNLFNR